MQILFDFFPIILFFIAFKLYGIYIATVVAIVATVIQVGFTWIKHRKIEKMHIVTLILITVLGGATLYFQNELFIKWKPTIVNWLFGIVFLGSQVIGDRTIIERMMKQNLDLPQAVWRRLNLSWALFFITLGCINVYVLYQFDTETWVNFKLFGMLGLTITFVVAQGIYLSKHIPEAETED
ncbi:MAG: septation protein A [Methylococcales bacterium]